MKIAVIGSGIAGLSAAFYLARRHEVVLFEQDDRVGGHTHTIEVPTANGVQAVDTGWINDENPLWKANLYAKAHNFQTPLDEVDAAARVLDPVFDGVNKGGADLPFGVFFKDYHVTEW